MTPREVLIESVSARERIALANLGAATGGASLCSLSRAGTSVPAVKYHEGEAASLAEARRALKAVAEGPGAERAARTVLLEIQARWQAQAGTVGRTGPSWVGYLTGGLDALGHVIDDDEGRGARAAQD
jgi:hypothetical protein